MIENTMSPLDSLNQDLSSVEIGFPLFQRGQYLFRQENAGVETKDNGKSSMFAKFAVQAPAPGIRNGKEVEMSAGAVFTHFINLDKTEKYTQDRINEELKKYMVGMGESTGAVGDPSRFNGRQVLLLLDIQVDKSGKYSDKNVVKKFTPFVC